MKNSTLFDKKIEQLQSVLEKNPEIKLAILFGSYAKGNLKFESDIDIAIKLDSPLTSEKKIKLIQLIAAKMGRAVDLIDLKTVGEPLLNQIIKTGIMLKGDKQMFVAMAIKNVYANEDFLPYIKRSLQERREKWI
jgi:predicted nucleotidyltransferase